MPRESLVITCEHGGNRVPARYKGLFKGRAQILRTHRGYDPGALSLARHVARRHGAPLVSATVSRLVIELNRSIGHPALFSEITRALDPGEKQALLDRYYHPYRERVESALRQGIRRTGRVLHVSVHTFTPVLDGKPRRADVGLLYDPRRRREKLVCARMREALATLAPDLRVRSNYPYRGSSDGLTTAMRRRFPKSRYAGIEIELNQGLVRTGRQPLARAAGALTEALAVALAATRGHGLG
jgi:predicted N-formylglutamate amidohydrolase